MRRDLTSGYKFYNEWLVFRIAVAATPTNPNPGQNVPEPASLALAALALAATGLSRRAHAARRSAQPR